MKINNSKDKIIPKPVLTPLYSDEIQMLFQFRINKLMTFHDFSSIEYKSRQYIGNPEYGFVEVFMDDKKKDFEIIQKWLMDKKLFGVGNKKENSTDEQSEK